MHFPRSPQATEPADGLLIVDCLQLVQPSRPYDGAEREIADGSCQGFKRLARELNLPVLAVSRLSRASDRKEDKRPRLSDLRAAAAASRRTPTRSPTSTWTHGGPARCQRRDHSRQEQERPHRPGAAQVHAHHRELPSFDDVEALDDLRRRCRRGPRLVRRPGAGSPDSGYRLRPGAGGAVAADQ